VKKIITWVFRTFAPTFAKDALDPKHIFIPYPVFNRWISGASYVQVAGYPAEGFEEHYLKRFVPILQVWWYIKGTLIMFVWGWWWVVESETEKELKERVNNG
jgi:hypothetical protein